MSVEPQTVEDAERHLHATCRTPNASIVSFLLEAFPTLDINSTHQAGVWTALHEACDFGHHSCFQLLSKHPRIDMNKPDKEGRTGLFWASFRDRSRIVWDLLQDDRVDPALANKAGETPLFKAVALGHEDTVERFLACNRVLDLKTPVPGRTLAHVAMDSGRLQMAALLEEYQKNPDLVRFRLRCEMGLTDAFAAEMFCLTVYFCDDFLQFKKDADPNSPAARVLAVLKELPMDLQMLFCNRMFGLSKNNINSKATEAAFAQLARKFGGELK